MKIKLLTLSVASLLLLLTIVGWLAAQSDPPRSPEQIIALSEGDVMAYYRPAKNAAPTPALSIASPEALPTAWTRLVFDSYKNSNWNIYAVQPDGANLTQLTTHNAVDFAPSFNHGATQYVFTSNRDGNYEIYKAATDSASIQRLTNHSADDTLPKWSQNGRIAFQSNRDGNTHIYVMDENGANLQRLTSAGSYNGMPSWSPDGSQIVFASNRSGNYELWIMNADGSNQHHLPNTAPAFYPSWSPIGDKIAFARDNNGDSFLEIWLINVDGTESVLWLNNGYDQDRWFPAWSPDGKYIAYTDTSWTLYQGQYYWTSSYIRIRDLDLNSYSQPVDDDRAWRSHWATTDTTPPGLCTVSVTPLQRWPQFNLDINANDDLSGVAYYDVQMRLPGQSWQTAITQHQSTRAFYQGATTAGTAEFRCRAIDVAGNARDWLDAPIATTQIDSVAPSSEVTTLPPFIASTEIPVSWFGSDAGTGLASYNVYMRDGAEDWTLWQDHVTITSTTFTGEIGHTYAFRSQAIDQAGHTERWQPVAQTAVTLYTIQLTTTLKDNRGYPAASASGSITPTSIVIQNEPGIFDAYLSAAGTYTLTFMSTGYGTLPAIRQPVSNDLSRLAVFPPVDNFLQNGAFEQPGLDNWEIKGNVSLTSTAHTGTQSVTLQDVGSGTSISQSLTISDTAHQPTLSLLYQLPATGTLTAHIQSSSYREHLSVNTPSPLWTHLWADLSPFAGETITLTLAFTGTGQTVYLDDVSIGSWMTPQITSVTPNNVQRGELIDINGHNFMPLVQIYLDDLLVQNTTWVSSTLMTAQIPNTVTLGSHEVIMYNESGATAVAGDPIVVKTNTVYLPVISKGGIAAIPSFARAGWLTLGYDAAHTGYQAGDPGASRYALAWRETLPFFEGARELEQIAIADGVLIAANDAYPNAAIIGYNAYTGAMLWNYLFDQSPVNPPTIAYGFVYFQQGKGFGQGGGPYLFCLDQYSGALRWRSPFSSQWDSYLAPIVVEDAVYMNAGADGGVQATNALTGEALWFKDLDQYDKWTPAYADGFLFAWVYGNFYAINPDTGHIEWSLNVGWDWHGYTMDTTPVIMEHTALVASSIQLTAINLDTHAIRWSQSGNYDYTIPAVAGNEVYAFGDGNLEVRNLHDGALLWSFDGNGELINAPVLTENYVYIASANHTYVLDRQTYNLVWETNKGGWLSVADGFLYIAQPGGIVSAYRAQEP